MESFSLLKYWRGGGSSGGGGDGGSNGRRNVANTTIVTAVAHGSVHSDDDDDDDDGPFFDLEFAVPADEEEDQENNENNGDECAHEGNEEEEDDDEDGESEGEGEFNFRVSSGSSTNDGVNNVNGSLSPSDDLFFKGKLVAIEPSSLSDSNSKLQLPVSFLKSATKFRVFMLGFKKSKSTTVCEKVEPASSTPKQQQKQEKETPPPPPKQPEQQSKLFTLKFKVEEVPLVSLFTRDNSSRNSSTTNNKSQKPEEANATVSDERQRFSKDVVQKYLKMVKPLYIRVSRRYGEKLKFSGQLNAPSPPPPTVVVTNDNQDVTSKTESVESESSQSHSQSQAPTPTTNSSQNVKNQKQVSLPLPAGLRVVCKHLGKSRSASSVASPGPSPTNLQSRRRDDSLLQQQDGIQGAILHCKRSFNAPGESDLNSSLLLRSASDPSHDKCADLTRKSSEEEKESRVC